MGMIGRQGAPQYPVSMRWVLFLAVPVLSFGWISCDSPDPAADSKAEAGDAKEAEATAPDEEEGGEITAVDAAEAARLLEDEPAVAVLDIRTPEEFAEGHIEGAINVDFMGDDFEAGIAELDRERPYVVHCRSGNRSTQSLPVFEKLDFDRIYHLETGLEGWAAEGLPTAK